MFKGKHREVHNIFCTSKKELENDIKIIYRIKFIGSVRFMPSSHYQVLLIILLNVFTMTNTKIVNLISEYVKLKINY